MRSTTWRSPDPVSTGVYEANNKVSLFQLGRFFPS